MPRSTPDSWEPCPAGTVAQLPLRLQAQQRRQFLVLTASATTALFAGGWLVWNLVQANELSCQEVAGAARKYLRKELQPEMAQRVEAHLQHCEHCRVYVERLKSAA